MSFVKMSAGRTMEGAGCSTWWGFSPALDLLDVGPERQQGEVNILLVGCSDPRHILKTIAGMKDTDTLSVWVIENSTEVVARQLLLLFLSLTSTNGLGMHEKVEVFLEVFGNSEIRNQTEEILRYAATQLSLSVSDMLSTQIHPCLDTGLLKYKERDELAWIFKQWLKPPSHGPLMSKAWDGRVRQYLGSRYDSKHGCYDWDLTMKLYQKGCGVISKQQYVKWRDTGLAFELREGNYQIANQSLLSNRIFGHRSGKVAVRGYWGDIVTSPYLCFGIETDDKKLLKKHNNQHVKTAQDISFANVLALFQALSNRGSPPTACLQASKNNNREESQSQTSEIQLESNSSASHRKEELQKHYDHPIGGISEECQPHSETKEKAMHYELMTVNGVRVFFLPLDSLSKLPEKQRYSQFFNTIYCSASMAHTLKPSLKLISASEAILIVELGKYLLDLSKEQEAGFTQKIKEITLTAGFSPTLESTSDVHAVFTLQQQ
ncbi:dynein assembly factor 3, axonemal-like [Alosa sapidissima]|uniref:dynein assembly factor 3, axonemal-like n=1 Tax=Alosa sapidissima TaxID=34773 RepID=UPI001C092895|nr:dynein assembly factor 3, axonemal-like [Alosa sapidissima]